uniref:ORF83 n=1 Tax=Malaco herpesvirus 1 TaxID=3031797 RepID=A0AA48P952_9VIRU|nr:TPA_asm: ORF83 [Malaco herpesvirus 1]
MQRHCPRNDRGVQQDHHRELPPAHVGLPGGETCGRRIYQHHRLWVHLGRGRVCRRLRFRYVRFWRRVKDYKTGGMSTAPTQQSIYWLSEFNSIINFVNVFACVCV